MLNILVDQNLPMVHTFDVVVTYIGNNKPLKTQLLSYFKHLHTKVTQICLILN